MDHGDSSAFRTHLLATPARVAVALFAAANLLCVTTVAAARQAGGYTLGIVDEEPLRAGQFQWSDDGVAAGEPLLIVVSLATQRARVYQGDVLIAVTTISSGKRGHETPVGTYSILQKQRFHRSNLYDDAPMPFMLRLTWGGLAIHGGQLPGRPASHGCIRVPQRFASRLFAIATYDTMVVVTDRETSRTAAAVRRDEALPEPDIMPLDPLLKPYEP